MNEPSPRSEDSLTAFADFLRRRERDPETSFEDFCTLRPTLAEELRALWEDWRRASELVDRLGRGPTLAERLKKAWGDSIDLDVSLSGPEEDGDSGASTVSRLSRSGGKTYRQRGLVARGGMGAILRVWDGDLRRTLAMKVVLGRDEEPDATGTPRVGEHQLVRFLEEAQITGQLDHPGILPVHDLGIDESGRVYFTMPLVRGETLKEIFEHVEAREQGWTTTRALGVLVKVCEAMAFAHSKGVIHRDLKPANVMVGRFGETYVMDWGLAKVLGRRQSSATRERADVGSSMSLVKTDRKDAADSSSASPLVTMDGDVVGTPAYMAPEQARGALDELGPASDVYALGAMLYQLLTGSAPYHEPGVRVSQHTVLARVLEGPPKRVEELRRGVPHELVAICNKAMARDAERRYPSMLDLAEDLRAFVEGHVVRAYETGAVAEFRKWVGRNRVAAGALALALVVAIAGLSTVIVMQSRSSRKLADRNVALVGANEEIKAERDRAEANEREAERLRASAQEMAARARRQSYLGGVRAAESSLELERAAQAKEMLASCEVDLRGWEWRYLARRADAQSGLVEVEGLRSAALSDDGRTMALVSPDKIRLVDRASCDTVAVLSHPQLKSSTPVFAALSPDHRLVYSLHLGGNLWVWDARTGAVLQRQSAHRPYAVFALALSRDGRRLASAGQDTFVFVWDTESQEVRTTLPCPALAESLAFSPDGRRLAVGLRDGGISVWDLEAAAQRGSDDPAPPDLALTGHGATVRSVAWSPDGLRIVSGSGDGTARVWDAATGEALLSVGDREHGVAAVAFDPKGGAFATGGDDELVRLWDAETGRELSALLGHTDGLISLAFAPGGDHLISAANDDTARVWDLARDPLYVELDARGELECLALSPGGELLAVGREDGALLLWDAATGAPRGELSGAGQAVTALAFAPDGRRLASVSGDLALRVWDTERHAQLFDLRGHTRRPTCVAASRDGAWFASGGADRQIRVWEAATGASRWLLQGHRAAVNAVAFGASSDLLVSGSSDATLHVWEVSSGQYRMLEGHGGDVLCAAVSPDGSMAASGSKDRTARLWDVESGACLAVLTGHEDDVVAVAFDEEGTRLVTASADGFLRVYDLALAALLVSVRCQAPLRGACVAGNRIAAGGNAFDDGGSRGLAWVWDPP